VQQIAGDPARQGQHATEQIEKDVPLDFEFVVRAAFNTRPESPFTIVLVGVVVLVIMLVIMLVIVLVRSG
jgi:hypothetical protein